MEFHWEKKKKNRKKENHLQGFKSALNKPKQHFPEILHELCTPRVSSKLGTYQMAGQQ